MYSTSTEFFGKLQGMDNDLKNKTLDELEEIVAHFGQREYQAKYIFNFIHAKNINDISLVSPLSKEFRKKLFEQGYYISELKVIDSFTDPDGTIKYLFVLTDGKRVEAVLLFEDKRKTLCVSTQVGCAMNCAFCATGKLKFQRNLTAGEIADQVNTVQRNKCKITNLVYMGMGEPFMNYDAVLKSIRILNHPDGKNLGIRHITISTCGDARGIEKLASEDVHPRLAISLNAPTDSLRTKLMPINSKYPLPVLLKAVNLYQRKTRQRVTFEYILIKGLNDAVLYAQAFVKLLRGLKCNVNLIEYNPHPGCDFIGSDKKVIERFAEIIEKGGIETTIRLRKGQEIMAACGQLGSDRQNVSSRKGQK